MPSCVLSDAGGGRNEGRELNSVKHFDAKLVVELLYLR